MAPARRSATPLVLPVAEKKATRAFPEVLMVGEVWLSVEEGTCGLPQEARRNAAANEMKKAWSLIFDEILCIRKTAMP